MTTHDTLRELAGMPELLEAVARRFAGSKSLEPGPEAGFCFLEQVWHLADLERRGYGERIRRILSEDRPALADFDGAREAQEGRYRERDLAAGLAAFRQARIQNLATLRSVAESGWSRPATQEGVGDLRLEDVPRMMAEHDASHRAEIQQLLGDAPGGERTWGSSLVARALGLLLVLPLLGCPYDAPFPLGSPADTPRDARLLGQWRCVAGWEEAPMLLTITPLEDRQYSLVMTSPGEESPVYRAWVSTLKGGSVLNVQHVKDGKPEQEWIFARYLVPTASSLVLDLAEDTLLKDLQQTPPLIQAAFEGADGDKIFEPFCVCTRVEEHNRP